MKREQFLDYLRRSNEFGATDPDRAQKVLINDKDITAREMATVLIMLGATASHRDWGLYSEKILQLGKEETGESLIDSFEYVLESPMNAAIVRGIVFDRINALITIQLIDGTTHTYKLNLPINPEWEERPAVRYKQGFLITQALNLSSNYTEKGKILN